jgi:hypothetical protein
MRRQKKTFGAGDGQTPGNAAAGRNHQKSDGDQEHWHRRRQHYLDLAESAGNTDKVDRENYWQHAEHFFRLIAEAAEARRRASVDRAVSVPALPAS